MRRATYGRWYVLIFTIAKEDGDKLRVVSTGFVDELISNMAFPPCTPPFARRRLIHNTLKISRRADHKDKVGSDDLLLHPQGPAIRGGNFVLVNLAIDSISPQTIRKLKHTVFMRRRIVTVTYENLRDFLFLYAIFSHITPCPPPNS
jgi:hypothetical protein